VVAVTLSGGYRVGVDVEPAVPRSADRIVWSELSPSERVKLATAPEAERAWCSCACGRSRRLLTDDTDPRHHGTPIAYGVSRPSGQVASAPTARAVAA
jgi:hypothetical protein